MNTKIPNTDDILNYFKNYNLTKEDLDFIQSKMTKLTLKKGDSFLEEGEKSNRIGLLMNGLLYASFGEEKETVSRFFYLPQNPIVTNFDSFKTGTISNENIRALETSHLFCIHRIDLDDLYNRIPALNIMGRELAEESYIKAQKRNHFLQILKNEEKLKLFHEEHPDLIARVSVNHLSSYLGMCRTEVSRHKKSLKNVGKPTTH